MIPTELVMVGVPYLSNRDGLEALVDSIDIPARLVVVNNGKQDDVVRSLRGRNPRVEAVEMGDGSPWSVARSWNELMREYEQRYVVEEQGRVPLIISNDDIVFRRGTLKMMRDDHIHNGQTYSVLLSDAHWSCYMINPVECWARVGHFDEAFFPAYHEDCDYDRRLKLARHAPIHRGYPVIHEGSATIKSYPEVEMEQRHHRFFRRNQNYYVAKWGGLPGEETYTRPFENEYWETP